MDYRVAILTVSDRSSRGERPDISGPTLAEIMRSHAWQVVRTAIVPDEQDVISQTIIDWCDDGSCDLILTTGGTGFSPRDVTPEATRTVIDREAPGLSEAMRREGARSTPHAMLSRGIAGIRNRCLVVNLPGSPKGASEDLNVIVTVLAHAIQLIRDDPGSEAGH
jgi:molybdopterin adenylyltransferase